MTLAAGDAVRRHAEPRREGAARPALEIIRREIGTREQGENVVRHTKWWGWGAVAYCVVGVSTAFKKGVRWAGYQQVLADAKTGEHDIHLTNDPDPGCPGVVDIYGDALPDHAITFVKGNGDGTAKPTSSTPARTGRTSRACGARTACCATAGGSRWNSEPRVAPRCQVLTM